MLGADLGAAACSLVLWILPSMSFSLHRRALLLFFIAAALFCVGEATAALEGLLAEDVAGITISVLIYDVSQVLLVVCVILGAYSLFKAEQNEVSSLRRAADVDELTAMNNRAFFREAAVRRIDLSRKNGIPLACIVLDIDDFKPYNDEFGHGAGDEALRCVAQALREVARADDLPARYGGEEFVLMLNASLPEAAAVAERVRSRIEEGCRPERDASLLRRITVSLGVAALTEKASALENLLQSADEELYRAKRAGKNRVCVDGLR